IIDFRKTPRRVLYNPPSSFQLSSSRFIFLEPSWFGRSALSQILGLLLQYGSAPPVVHPPAPQASAKTLAQVDTPSLSDAPLSARARGAPDPPASPPGIAARTHTPPGGGGSTGSRACAMPCVRRTGGGARSASVSLSASPLRL